MSSGEGESRGRRSRRVAAQQNASGKEGIPAKKDMTAEELKRYGFIYFEGGRWERDAKAIMVVVAYTVRTKSSFRKE